MEKSELRERLVTVHKSDCAEEFLKTFVLNTKEWGTALGEWAFRNR